MPRPAPSPPRLERTALLLVAAALMLGCGYRPVTAAFPEGDGAVVIPQARNDTPFPGLGSRVTAALRVRTAAAGIAVVASGAPELRVAITMVSLKPGMLRRQGDHLLPVDIIQTIQVRAAISGPGEEVIVPPEIFEVSGRSYADGSMRREAILAESRRRRLLDDIAAMIVEYMFES